MGEQQKGEPQQKGEQQQKGKPHGHGQTAVGAVREVATGDGQSDGEAGLLGLGRAYRDVCP